MWIWLWSILGIFFWFTGFFQASFFEEDEEEGTISNAFVQPPSLIYFLCGRPTASNVPKGVVALRSLMAQLQGILFVTYAMAYKYIPIRTLSTQVIILSLVGFAIMWFCWLIYKRYPYKKMNNLQIKK